MSSDETATAAPPEQRRPKPRFRFPLLVFVAAVLGIGVTLALPEDMFGRGVQNTLVFLIGVLGGLLLLVWAFFLSPLRLRGKAVLLLVLVLLALGGMKSIRRVDFTGDMQPSFEFIWEESRDAKLVAYHASHDRDELPPIEITPDRENDMPQYRGHHRDGIVVGPELARDWEEHPPELVWRQPVGAGHAAFSVTGNVAITIEQRGDMEAVVAYDAATGAQRWIYKYPALFTETAGGPGPRASVTIHGDRAYSVGGTGVLTCLDARTGELVWSQDILDMAEATNLTWGMAGSPLVYDGQVIVSPGAQGSETDRAVMAFDAENGELLWHAGNSMGSYASPTIAEFEFGPQVIVFDSSGIVAYDPNGAGVLWSYPWKTFNDNSAAQPLVWPDGRVMVTSDAGCMMVEVAPDGDDWQVEELWTNQQLKGSFANAIYYDDAIFGLDKGILVCLDVETGKRKWKKGRYGHGQMLLAGDLLVILSEQGELAIVEASSKRYNELGRIPAIEGRTWNNPALVDGRIYVRNHLEMACYDLLPQ